MFSASLAGLGKQTHRPRILARAEPPPQETTARYNVGSGIDRTLTASLMFTLTHTYDDPCVHSNDHRANSPEPPSGRE
ncbi:MAG: hypothetical protein ACR2OA_01575 [Rubripirellula sp.]